MNKIITALNRKKGYEKTLTVMLMICSLYTIILAIMQITRTWDKAINVIVSLTGVVMLIQALQNWRKNRKLAVYSLFVAIFAFCCVIVIY